MALGGVAVAIALAAVLLTFRSGGIGVTPAEASCTSSEVPSLRCARAMASVLLPGGSAIQSRGPRRIAYSQFSDSGRADIYTMNAGGGDVRRLTTNRARSAFPAWSPDGTRIAFNLTGASGPSGVYLMRADGSNERLLARGPWAAPAWSPDGSKIAFSTRKGIVVVTRVEGRLQLVRRLGWAPSWSPDGTRIAYTRGSSEIYVMNADGTGSRFLTQGSFPAWSPDGATIAFHGTLAYPDHTAPIRVIRVDERAPHPVSLHRRTWIDCALAWSPSGQVAFSNPTGLYVARSGSPVATKIASGDVCGVAWQPQRHG